MTFKEKLVRLRKLKGITQDEFASAVGVSRQAVYKWESGQSYPEVAKLLEIKLLFGISIDDLLDDTYEIALPEKKKRKRLSEDAKRRIEEMVRREEEDGAAYSAPAAAEVKTAPAPVKEPVYVAKEAPKAEPVVEEPKAAATPVATEAKAENAAPEEKKKGFFARLFGGK